MSPFRPKCTLRVIALVVLVLVVHAGRAQQGWYREQFMSESGLLQNRVHAMVRDRWGGLLIGTEGGLVRYDGHHFRQIGIPAPEGMRPSRVLDILPTDDGTYVVRDAGCRQFVHRDDRLQGLTMEAPARPYTSRFAGGMLDAGIALRAMDPDSLFPGKDEWPAIVRPVTLEGRTWCLRSDSVLLIYNGAALERRMPLPLGRSSHLFKVDGRLYTLDREGRAMLVDVMAQSVTPVSMEGPRLTAGTGHRLFWDPQQQVASILLDKAIYMLEHNASGGLVARSLGIELPQDAKVGGLVWLDGLNAVAVGTDTKGLFIYRRHRMVSHLCDAAAEGVNNAYNAQAPYGRDGVLTSNRAGTKVFTASGCDPGRPPIQRFNDAAILLDREQRYWYGRGDTLFRYDAVLEEETIVRMGMRPLCFLEEGADIWVGTGKGVFRISKGVVALVHPIGEGDLSLRPLSLCRTPQGELWMATCAGVFRIADGGGWAVVPGLERICARELAVIGEAVFVGTYGSGAFMCIEGKVHALPMDHQEFLSHVHAFMPDGAGFLWMSTNQGLFRVRSDDLRAWIRDPRQRVYYAYYGKWAGIANAEFNGGCSPAFVRTADGWASLPTMDGLVWFRPEEIQDAYPWSGFLLEKVMVDGEEWDGHGPLHWSHQDVTIGLSLAYWGSPENVLLEYAVGEAGRWTPMAPGQRELRLGAIPAGDQKVRVRKIGARFRGDEQELVLRFDVLAPYYKRPWFIAGSAMSAVLLFMGGIRLNAVRLRRRNLQLERMVAERTGELVQANEVLRRSLEMKEMLVSIISHDIVTPLRFLARVSDGLTQRIEQPADPILMGTLSDVARSSDKLFSNAQDLLQWIKRQDGRIDLRIRDCVVGPLVEEVLDRERERASEQGTSLFNTVPVDHVIRTDRNVLSIILHNAVVNAVTHTPEGRVMVAGESRGGYYHLTVTDTGTGMPPAALEHAERVARKGALGAMNADGERDVQGLGLLIIADLLGLLNGSFSVISHPDQGTSITIVVPLDHSGNVPSGNGV